MRASRLRWTSPFHLTGNFNILTLDHIRLLCWSRCDRANWKADVKIWVATLATCPSRCRVPSRSRRWRSLICCGNLLKTSAYKKRCPALAKRTRCESEKIALASTRCGAIGNLRNRPPFALDAKQFFVIEGSCRSRPALEELGGPQFFDVEGSCRSRPALEARKNSKWKSRAQVVREFPQSPQGRLRHQRPVPQGTTALTTPPFVRAGYDCRNNTTVLRRPEAVGWAPLV